MPPNHINETGVAYFVTWRLHASQNCLQPAERTLIQKILWFGHGETYQLMAYVVMDDHLHVLTKPHTNTELPKLVKSWKSISSRQILSQRKQPSPLWQKGYFDRGIWSDHEFEQKSGYILGNPRKRWPELEDYPWVWGMGYPRPEDILTT